MKRTDERREILAILDQLKSAALATFPANLKGNPATPSLTLSPAMWEEVRPVAEGLGMSIEVGPTLATFRGILAGTRIKFTASFPEDFDALSRMVRANFAPPPQVSIYAPQAPRRAIGNFRTTADQRRTLEAAEHNLYQAKASGNRELIAVMEQALNDTRKRVNFARLDIVHSQSETPTDEPMKLSVAEQVAVAYAKAIRRELSPEELAEVLAKNEQRRKRGPLKWKCHSDKLTDTIGLLNDVWLEVTGAEFTGETKEESAQFNDAFVLARDSGYDPEAIGREIEKAA